jgi:hypothetical protein
MSAMETLKSESGAGNGPDELFIRLRQLARRVPEPVATVSLERTATYRKLWSRVERATARLQGEWGVTAGRLVVYQGRPHPDALVLWLALCRLGACLLPFEQDPACPNGGAPVPEHPGSEAMLSLHADDILPSLSRVVGASRPLSSLIMQPCPHRSVVVHEDGLLDCIEFPPSPTGRGPCRFNLRELMSEWRQAPGQLSAVGPGIELDRGALAKDVLGPLLLPALMAGRCLVFGATPLSATQPAAAGLR